MSKILQVLIGFFMKDIEYKIDKKVFQNLHKNKFWIKYKWRLYLL